MFLLRKRAQNTVYIIAYFLSNSKTFFFVPFR